MKGLANLLPEIAGMEPMELHTFAHDASIGRIQFVEGEGCCHVTLQSSFISKFHGLDAATTFVITVESIRSLFAIFTWMESYPDGTPSPPPHYRFPEHARFGRPNHYYRTRTESQAWPEVERRMIEEPGWEVYDGQLYEGPEVAALVLQIHHRSSKVTNDTFELALSGTRALYEIEGSGPLGLSDLLNMGRAYWDDWSEQGERRRLEREKPAET